MLANYCALMVVCCRSLLASIVKIKMEHYEMSKVRSQSAEEYLKAFFEAELKSIWPQGWMQARFVARQCCTVWVFVVMENKWSLCDVVMVFRGFVVVLLHCVVKNANI